jgi:hypothetical protein
MQRDLGGVGIDAGHVQLDGQRRRVVAQIDVDRRAGRVGADRGARAGIELGEHAVDLARQRLAGGHPAGWPHRAEMLPGPAAATPHPAPNASSSGCRPPNPAPSSCQ